MSQITISRSNGRDWESPLYSKTETYFAAVQTLLDSARTPEKWGTTPLHSEYIKVTVKLGERRHTLYAGHGVSGPTMWLDPQATDQRQFETLQEIVRLTVAHASALIGGGGMPNKSLERTRDR